MQRSDGGKRQWAAIVALLLFGSVLAVSVWSIADNPRRGLALVPLLLVVLLAVWYTVTRDSIRRTVGVIALLATVVGVVGIAATGSRSAGLRLLVQLVLLLVAAALCRYALGRDLRSLKEMQTPGVLVPPARHGVLIINPRSGGGKAERFHLEVECRKRAIEPMILQPGDDLTQLATDAVDRGADVIGMAGGDGSQALVATVASERGVAMVVVPAGTRNHLALDLGLDREDVVGALDAFGDAVTRPLDLAQVNDRVFVNNVSLGIYAAIIASPEYRDAKVDTTLATLPKVLGPGSSPFDLHFAGPDGEHHDSAHMILVSNNPYGKKTVDTIGSRPRLDTGRLGVITLELAGDRMASQFFTAVAAKKPEEFRGFSSWTTERFEVTSSGPIDVGLDGEALTLDPPLQFSVRDTVFHVRLPKHAIGHSPAARAMTWREAGRGIWRVARGKPTGIAP